MEIQIVKPQHEPTFEEFKSIVEKKVRLGSDYRLEPRNRAELRKDEYHCDKCGTHAYVKWYGLPTLGVEELRNNRWCNVKKYRYKDDYIPEDRNDPMPTIVACMKDFEANQTQHRQRDDAKKCPVCGSEYSEIFYDSSVYDIVNGTGYYGMPEAFSVIKDQRLSKCVELKNIEDHLDGLYSLTEELESKYSIHQSSPSTKSKLNTEQLQSYLLSMIQLETDIMTISEHFNDTLLFQCECAVSRAFADGPLCDVMTPVAEKVKAYYEAIHQRENNKPVYREPQLPAKPQEPRRPEYKKPGLFNKKKIEAENQLITYMYNTEKNAYEQKLKQYHEDVASIIERAKQQYAEAVKSAENELEKTKQEIELARKEAFALHSESPKETRSQRKMNILMEEVRTTQELLEKLYRTRSEMYALNIVFDKYRNLVALSTFYEYLLSGRCDSLEGANGAYNLYEAEIRADMVISQLSDVVESLDDIAETQHTVYTQLCNMNETVSQLNEACEKIAYASEAIAANTKTTAYYAKVNANLTKALGFMVAIK